MRLLCTALLATLCSSCSLVVSKQPVGSKPVDAAKAGLTGTWATEDGEERLTIGVKDAKKGTMTVTGGEDEAHEVIIRKSGDLLFASLKMEDEDYYGWVELKVEGDKLRLRTPDHTKFEKLHNDKKLPSRLIEFEYTIGGKTEKDHHILIDDASGKWLGNLVAGKLGDPYDNEETKYLNRVP